jgi:hypothetical protein
VGARTREIQPFVGHGPRFVGNFARDPRGTRVADLEAMWIVTLMPSFIALGLFFGTLAIRPMRR